jgi:peptidoglycan glycosyltransferase
MKLIKYLLCIVVALTIINVQNDSAREIPWDQGGQFQFPLKSFNAQLTKNPNKLPHSIFDKNKEFEVSYTLNEKLNKFILNLITEYRPDFASIAVVDNETGNIIGLVDFGRKQGDLGLSLTINGEHPSASLFKIITSAALLQNGNFTKDSLFQYKGRATTLYKSQLKEEISNVRVNSKRNKSNEQTLIQAFSKSNNVIFAKAALRENNQNQLIDMAKEFGLEQDLMVDLPLPKSKIYNPKDKFGIAELASGFNKETTMTPIHGALLSQIVANNGVLVYPRIIKSVTLKNNPNENSNQHWGPQLRSKKVLKPQVASDLQEMMEFTVEKGTAQKAFRGIDKKIKNEIHMGGKTGSITGGGPHGKRDWFTVFAKPESDSTNKSTSKGISICVMIINVNKWYVKSSFIARKIIEFYFNPKNKVI